MSAYRKWFNTASFGLDPDETGIGWNDHAAKPYQLPEELHPTRWTGDVAVSVIDGYDNENPLFLKVSFARPHSPYDAPQRVLDMYKDKYIPSPWHSSWSDIIGNQVTDPSQKKDAPFAQFGDDYAVESRRNYYAAVTFIDEEIGKIVDALKKKGIYDNSLICFISDHGDMLGDHNHWRKTYAYEGSSAIPFIVKLPANNEVTKKTGSVIEEPVRSEERRVGRVLRLV